jgi:REP element-mobilizing transposase RayT
MLIAPLFMGIEPKEGSTRTFEPVDPWASEDLVFKRRNLPHLNVSGATYFVTFRSKMLLPPDARDLVIALLRDFTAQYIYLDAAVVMPDHVHLILRLSSSADRVNSGWMKASITSSGMRLSSKRRSSTSSKIRSRMVSQLDLRTTNG